MNYLEMSQRAERAWAKMSPEGKQKFERRYGNWESLDYKQQVKCLTNYFDSLHPTSERTPRVVQVQTSAITANVFSGLDDLVNRLKDSHLSPQQKKKAELGLVNYLETLKPLMQQHDIPIPEEIIERIRNSQYNIGDLLALVDGLNFLAEFRIRK